MSIETRNYVIVKVGNRWDLGQLADLESQLLTAFPSQNVFWASNGVMQSLADYAESEGLVSSHSRSADWLQPEVIYVALGWLGGAVATQIVEQAVTATMEAVKGWWRRRREERNRDRAGTVTVVVLSMDGKELGRASLDLDQDDATVQDDSPRTADSTLPSGSDDERPWNPRSAET
jgi:hypothetical protein